MPSLEVSCLAAAAVSVRSLQKQDSADAALISDDSLESGRGSSKALPPEWYATMPPGAL